MKCSIIHHFLQSIPFAWRISHSSPTYFSASSLLVPAFISAAPCFVGLLRALPPEDAVLFGNVEDPGPPPAADPPPVFTVVEEVAATTSFALVDASRRCGSLPGAARLCCLNSPKFRDNPTRSRRLNGAACSTTSPVLLVVLFAEEPCLLELELALEALS